MLSSYEAVSRLSFTLSLKLRSYFTVSSLPHASLSQVIVLRQSYGNDTINNSLNLMSYPRIDVLQS